jgi:thiosulfate/3-mercaptopyruvate sulfurtransferase
MKKRSTLMSKLMIFMLALAVVFTYSVMPMSQSYAASSKKPAQVKTVKAKAVAASAVKLTWKKVKNAKSYQIYASVKKTTGFKKVAAAKASKSSYTVKKLSKKALKANKTYYFKVRAINGSKKGKFSKVVSRKTFKKVASVKKKTVYVTPQWLNSALYGEQKGYENVVVCEVAYGDPGHKDYSKAHVPGAIKVNVVEVEDATGDEKGAYNLLSVSEIRKNLVSYGITANTKVVLYDAGGDPCEVGRQAYGYLVAGVKDVKILNGHLDAWKKAGFETEKKANTRKSAKSFGDAKAHMEYWTSIESAKAKLDKNASTYDPTFKAVSIRSKDEWLGVTSGYGYMDKAGEPDGAVWGKGAETAFDAAQFVNADGTVKTLDGFKEVWKDCNFKVDGSDHLAFYCGTGWRATVPFLVLYENGFTNISVFDGGWYEWLMHDDYPVQVGDPASGNCVHTTVGALPTGKAAK